MKPLITFFLCLILSASIHHINAQNSTFPNQVILHFSPSATQTQKQDIIDQLGVKLQDDDKGAPGIGEVVLVEVASYPVMVDGQIYDDEVDLIGNIHNNNAKLDNTDLNYIINKEQLLFDEFVGETNLVEYSPLTAACEANYPGGPLTGGRYFGDTKVVVAVLDSGLDPYYATINNYVKAAVDVISDDNGSEEILVSDPYQIGDNIGVDEIGHGTAVSGIIAGLSDRARILNTSLEMIVIKCFDSEGNASLYNLIQALDIAADYNSDIINMSWSYRPIPEEESHLIIVDKLEALSNNGTILVAGAGNNNEDLSVYPLAPAGLSSIESLITVGGVEGVNCDGSKADFSNYGVDVDICAPSQNMQVPGLNGYWSLNAEGTSFAAPVVTAAVIQSWLFLNYDDSMQGLDGPTIHPIVETLLYTSTEVTSLAKYGMFGVVNFESVCTMLNRQSDDVLPVYQQKRPQTNQFNVSPNPFNDYTRITSLEDCSSKYLEVSLLSSSGKRIFQQELLCNKDINKIITFNQDLDKGMYFLTIISGSEVYTKPIVKI